MGEMQEPTEDSSSEKDPNDVPGRDLVRPDDLSGQDGSASEYSGQHPHLSNQSISDSEESSPSSSDLSSSDSSIFSSTDTTFSKLIPIDNSSQRKKSKEGTHLSSSPNESENQKTSSSQSHSESGLVSGSSDDQKETRPSGKGCEGTQEQHPTAIFDLSCGSTMDEPEKDSGDFVVSQEEDEISDDFSSASSSSEAILKSLEAPKWIGQYKVINKVGEGGMGVVYLAEQQHPVKRMVAIKVVKAGMDTVQVVARFETETIAISRMNHNGIAKVLDAGATEQGRPYFVMEFVDGISITKFCDRKKYDIRQRVQLFLDVCRPVHHAHQKDVIHRDLKPSNILVSEESGVNVKIIDFGLAKATGRQWIEDSFHTAHGQLIGTLEYMSPEQATAHQTHIDHRSDVYSLGVILYQVLCGSTPLIRDQVKEAGLIEVLERIRNEEPPVPSLRFKEKHSPKLCAQRGGSWKSVYRSINGDLDWIVMKAIAKRPSERYESAEQLLLDLENYLDGNAVSARPPSIYYKVSKSIAKNRFACLAIGSLVLFLMVGLATASFVAVLARQNARESRALLEKVQAHQRQTKKALELAEQQRKVAEKATEDANTEREKSLQALEEARQAKKRADRLKKQSEDLLHLITESFQNFDPGTGEGHELLASDALRLAYQNANTRFENDPIAKASLLQTLSWTFLGLGNYSLGIEAGNKGHEIYSKYLGPEDAKTIDTELAIFWNYHGVGDYDQSFPIAKRLRSISINFFGTNHPLTLRCEEAFAMAQHKTGDSEQAIVTLLKVIGRRNSKKQPNQVAIWKAVGYLAEVYRETGKPDSAIPLLSDILPLQVETLGEGHKDVIQTMNRLGGCLMEAGKVRQARLILNRSKTAVEKDFGRLHPLRIETRLHLAIAYRAEGDRVKAKDILNELKDDLNAGNQFLSVFGADVWFHLGMVYLEDNEPKKAKETLEEAVRLVKQKYSSETRKTWSFRLAFAKAAEQCGDLVDVEKTLEGVLNDIEQHSGSHKKLRLQVVMDLGRCYLKDKKAEKALSKYRLGIQQAELMTVEMGNTVLAGCKIGEARCLFRLEELDQALEVLMETEQLLAPAAGSDQMDMDIGIIRQLADLYRLRSQVRFKRKEANIAIADLEKSISLRAQLLELIEQEDIAAEAISLSDSLTYLSSVLAFGGNVEKIASLVESGNLALELMEDSKEVSEDQVLKTRQVLGNIQILGGKFEDGIQNLKECEDVYFSRFSFQPDALDDLLTADRICRTLSLTYLSLNKPDVLNQSIERSIKYLTAAEFLVEDHPDLRKEIISRCKELKQILNQIRKEYRSEDAVRRISDIQERMDQ